MLRTNGTGIYLYWDSTWNFLVEHTTELLQHLLWPILILLLVVWFVRLVVPKILRSTNLPPAVEYVTMMLFVMSLTFLLIYFIHWWVTKPFTHEAMPGPAPHIVVQDDSQA